MSLFAAMSAAVSGMKVQSSKMGHISDNIANVNTTSYKRIGTSFQTLVTQSGRTSHSPAGVLSAPIYENAVQGQIQGSTRSTHIAMDGGGFFIVRNFPDNANTAGLNRQNFYTRRGDFRFDEKGNMVNNAGYYLQGRAYDATGQLTPGDLSTVNISNMGGNAKATQNVKIGANLPADAFVEDLTAAVPADHDITWGTNTTGAAKDYSIIVNGVTITATVANGGNINDGLFAAASVAAKATELSNAGVTVTQALAGDPLNFVGPATGDRLTINMAGSGGVDTVNSLGEKLVLPGESENYTEQTYYDSQGQAHTVRSEFVKTGNNQWSIRLLEKDAGNSWVNLTGTTPIVATFGVNGKLSSLATTMGGASVSGATLSLDPALPPLSTAMALTNPGWQWNDKPMEFNFGVIGEAAGLTQFSAEFAVTDLTQDGLPYGQFSGVNIDEYGDVYAQYGNGATLKIYNLPIAVFANPEGLENVDGNSLRATAYSGEAAILQPGVGRAGTIVSEALEASNVDIAEEFTQMIQAQRAYSANSRVISTADSMTEDIIRIIR